jgi:hypothetical protein
LKNWIANKVETVGAREEFIMLSSVNWMFEAVLQNLFAGDFQKSWLAVVHAVLTRG